MCEYEEIDYCTIHSDILRQIRLVEKAHPFDELQELYYELQLKSLQAQARLIRRYAKIEEILHGKKW